MMCTRIIRVFNDDLHSVDRADEGSHQLGATGHTSAQDEVVVEGVEGRRLAERV